jgi:hypothetical protein
MAVLPRLRTLITDHSGMPRLPVLAVLAALLVAVTLGLAALGGRAGLAGIGVVEAATVAGLLWAAHR